MMASDLQDPPETLGALLQKWRGGAQVVWATRREQPGAQTHAGFASIYYWIMRNVVGMKEIPARGADFFLIDRVVIEAFRRCDEQHVSVFALITWLGFRQEYIEYDKQPRAAGTSGWTIARKIKLVVDSITAFSDAPIQACWLAGVALMALGLVMMLVGLLVFESLQAAVVVLLGAMAGCTGLVLCALAMLGEYVWRALDQSRRRPLYLIEATAGPDRCVRGPIVCASLSGSRGAFSSPSSRSCCSAGSFSIGSTRSAVPSAGSTTTISCTLSMPSRYRPASSRCAISSTPVCRARGRR